MNKKENQPLTKKDFEKILTEALSDQAKSIIEAVDFGFENANKDRAEIKQDISEMKYKLRNIERRIIYIEDVITKHTKEIKAIRQELKEIKNSLKKLEAVSKNDEQKIIALEGRVEKLEMAAV